MEVEVDELDSSQYKEDSQPSKKPIVRQTREAAKRKRSEGGEGGGERKKSKKEKGKGREKDQEVEDASREGSSSAAIVREAGENAEEAGEGEAFGGGQKEEKRLTRREKRKQRESQRRDTTREFLAVSPFLPSLLLILFLSSKLKTN